MIRHQRHRLVEESLGPRRIRVTDELSQTHVEIRSVAQASHAIQNIGVQLDRLEVVGIDVEEPLNVGQGVLVHLVAHVHPSLDDELLARTHRDVVTVVADLFSLVDLKVVFAALIDIDVEVEIILVIIGDVDQHLGLART